MGPKRDELRKRVEEAEAQLREEAKIIERMTRDNRAKQEQINQMEAMLQREIEKHHAALRMQEDEALTQKLQADHELQVLRRKGSQLELHVEAYDVLERSNHALRERVDKLMQQLEDENRSHAEEIHKVRLDMFNHKMALEKTFRKALQELDAEYLKKAFNAMSEESKNALVANAKLKDELTLQSIGVDNLMQRFNQQTKHYQKMKIENDILEQESQLRLQDVASTKKAQLQAARTIEKLKDEVARGEHEWKQQAAKLIEELHQENQHVHKLHELAQKRCAKWKTRCLELAARETQRRADEQRAQTAPGTQAATSDFVALLRTQSQPALGPSMADNQSSKPNYDEMWNASLLKKQQSQLQQRETLTEVSSEPALQRIGAPRLDLQRARTAATAAPPAPSMKLPDAALLRARAKAPLGDLVALHLSSADLAALRHLDGCRRLRSLYANANVLKDLDGLLALRCLWHVDLSDNLLRQLQPLASFRALGFLHLERNQLTFDDLVCLRDVHLLDLRLGGNATLLASDADHLASVEYRMKTAALLPYAWTLDGHYVTTHERAQALDVCDDWVARMLARHTQGTGGGGSLRFGSTSDLWGGIADCDHDDLTTPVQEQALRLMDAITKQPTRNPEQQDLFRLRALAGFHDEESGVHNAHTQFAPQKHSATAKPMPAIRLRSVQALPPRARLEIGVLLAVHLDFPAPAKLLAEALTIAVLSERDHASAEWVHDLALLPPYAIVALLSVLRTQALNEHDKHTSSSATMSPLADSDLRLWKALPAVIPTLLQSDRMSRLEQHDGAPDHQLYLQRCAVAVSLLSRTTVFPSKPSVSSHGDLFQLLEAAKRASTASLESLNFAIPSVLVGDSTSSDMPWKKKNRNHPDRDYRKPWIEGRADISQPEQVASPGSSPAESANLKPTKHRRLPKPGEWLDVGAKCYLQIRSVASDGSTLTASPATDQRGAGLGAALVTLHMDAVARVSRSAWRLRTDEPHIRDEILQAISATPQAMRRRLGKLHRDSEGFHRHGAARNQGYPNHDVLSADLQGIESVGDEPLPGRQPQPVEVFSATDTLDPNYVLASPALISVQNAVAARNFHEQRRAPAGLWNAIDTASFQLTQPLVPVTDPAKKTVATSKKPPVLTRHASLPPPQSDDDWRDLQREMQALLGIRPRTPLPTEVSGGGDVKCFLTAVPAARDSDSDDGAYDHLDALALVAPDSVSARSSPAVATYSPMSAQPCDDVTGAMAPRSNAKPRKLEALAWHQVATKPQLLVAAASPVVMSYVPPRRAHGTDDSDGASGGGASAVEGGAAALALQRTPLRLTRCHVSLPTLSLISQK